LPRPRHPIRPHRWHVHVPLDVAAAVELRLYDAARGSTLYGTRSTLITGLLRKWLADPSLFPIDHNLDNAA
jgi:hypothetical protein